MKTSVIRVLTAAALISAVCAVSSCGASAPAPAVTAAQTTAAATPAATTVPATTTAPATTTTKKTTTTPAATTTAETTMSAKEKLEYESKRYTDAYMGEKLTEVKEMMINKGIALESRIEMYTDDGESLDHFYNAPSTYDITKIVFKQGGVVQLYGVKNRLIPDAAKDALKQSVIDRLADKITGHFIHDD